MAVTKIWDVRGRLEAPLKYIENPEKTENTEYGTRFGNGRTGPAEFDADQATDMDGEGYQSLADVIEYAANEDKTEKRIYVSGVNCNKTCAREQFITVKKAFDKEDGIIAYHAYQSFAPGETTPAEAHQVGIELAKRMWGDRFQVVVATHLNTSCLHNHFVINSVSFRDGKRYHDCKSTYQQLRNLSDEICIEHGLSVVEKPHRKETEKIWIAHASAAGMPTRYNLAREAIDEAVSKSCNMYEFEQYLKALGYSTQFNPRRKYWTVTPKGWKQPIRLARLGENYTNERIAERIRENDRRTIMKAFQSAKPKGRQYLLITRRDKLGKVEGLKGLYLRYCYELGYLPKYQQKNPNKVHYLLKEDLMKIDKISAGARLLSKYNVETMEDLNTLQNRLSEAYEAAKSEPNATELRREIKKEINSCKDIRARHSELEEKLEIAEQDREAEKETNQKTLR